MGSLGVTRGATVLRGTNATRGRAGSQRYATGAVSVTRSKMEPTRPRTLVQRAARGKTKSGAAAKPLHPLQYHPLQYHALHRRRTLMRQTCADFHPAAKIWREQSGP